MTITEFAQKIEKLFISEKLYYEVYYDQDRICVEIMNGDWKHDHLHAKWRIEELAKKCKLNKKLHFSEEVTDDSPDDTYSAIHVIRFT